MDPVKIVKVLFWTVMLGCFVLCAYLLTDTMRKMEKVCESSVQMIDAYNAQQYQETTFYIQADNRTVPVKVRHRLPNGAWMRWSDEAQERVQAWADSTKPGFGEEIPEHILWPGGKRKYER